MKFALIGKESGKIYVSGSEEYCLRFLHSEYPSSFIKIKTDGMPRMTSNTVIYPEPLIKVHITC